MDQHDRDWQAHGEKHATERGVLGALQFIGTAIASAIGVFVPKP